MINTTPTPEDHARALEALTVPQTYEGIKYDIAQAIADGRATGFLAGRNDYRDRVLGATVRTLDELRAAVVTLESLGDLA